MPKAKLRVFLDSNVIFSGLYSSKGAPGTIIRLFILGKIDVVVSQQVLEEVIGTLKEKLPDSLPTLKRLLTNTPPEVVADPALTDVKRWTTKLQLGDAAILAAAITARPDYFITGDRHFFKNPAVVQESGLNIVIPAQFLKIIESDGD